MARSRHTRGNHGRTNLGLGYASGCELSEANASALLETLKSYKNRDDLSDVTLVVGPSRKVYRCHRFVLSMRSEFFRNLLTGPMREGKEGETVVLPGFTEELFEVFLAYCYGDRIELTLENVQEVLFVADAYCLGELKGLCGRLLWSRVDEESALEALERAELLPECGLADRCVALIRSDLPRQCHARPHPDPPAPPRPVGPAEAALRGERGREAGRAGGALLEELAPELHWELLAGPDLEALAAADRPPLLPRRLLHQARPRPFPALPA
eukprot:tig00001234_g7745.t1